MSVSSVTPRDFILALFIRDDGERFLLGDNGYDFQDKQLHFAGNNIENDEVAKQGADGVMLAGQVRRSSVQSFDGYVGDASVAKDVIEQMRRDFFAFFVKGHHYRVVYIDTNKNAWQRKGGYLVDAPEVKELFQIHPEYHVALNFEDVNYYQYDEDADGQEILANIQSVPLSTEVDGGLVWDSIGAVESEAVLDYDTETKTTSIANPLTITDAVEAPLNDYSLYGDTVQNGTPSPSAPVPVKVVTGENVVKICGKNLFNTHAVVKGRLDNGVIGYAGNTTSLTANDNSITFTVDTPWRGCISEAIPVKPNTEYHMKATSSGATIGASSADYYSEEGWISRQAVPQASLEYSFTTPANCKYVRISWQTSQVGTATISNPQLELGSSATEFEAFSGQSYEVNLGKNLFDKSTATDGYRLGGDGAPYADAGYSLSTYIPVQPNTQYSYSRGGTTTGAFNSICYYDNSKTFISRTMPIISTQQTSGTLTTPSSAAYVRIADFTSQLDTMQFELGLQATSYAAYFTPIELCKIGTYQDYLYKSGDDWYVHKEIGKSAVDGTQGSLSRPSANRFNIDNINLGWKKSQNAIFCLANSYTTVAQYDTNAAFNTGTYNMSYALGLHPSANTIRIKDANYDSADNYKTWLGNNPIMLYYVLATPTDTTITNEALIAQLDAILASAQTYAGTTNISLVATAGNASGQLKVTYYSKYNVSVIGGGFVWEAGGSGGPTIIQNDSIDNVSPVWTVIGPTLNPVLENTTTGDTIEYVGMVADGQTLTIDMGAQTASLDGLNVIGNITGDWLELAPGANTILFSSDTADAPNSKIGWSEIVG